MAKSFDSKKARQTLDNMRNTIDEKKEKLGDMNESKQELIKMRKTLENLDVDEDVKNNMIELLIESYENLQDDGKQESNALDSAAKEADEIKSEIMDAEDDTKVASERLSNKSRVLEKFGINAFDEAKATAEESLQELQQLKEESMTDIQEIMKLSQELSSLWKESLVEDNLTKRTPQETENFTEAILKETGYINGNKFPFHRVENNGIAFLEKHPGNQKGDQKPDKYRFVEKSKELFIVEDKNYGVEKNINSLVNNIAKQAIKRVDACLDALVPVGELNNSEEGKIERINITFSIDLKGHYFHDDNTPVTIEELNKIPKYVRQKVISKIGEERYSKVNIRFSTLFNSLTNKPLDFSSNI